MAKTTIEILTQSSNLKCDQISPEILQLTEKLYGKEEREQERKQARDDLVRMGSCVLEVLFEIKYKVCDSILDDRKNKAIEDVITAIGVNDTTFLLKMLGNHNEIRFQYSYDILERIKKLGNTAVDPFLKWLTDPQNIRFLDETIVVGSIHEIAGEKGVEVLSRIAHTRRNSYIGENAIKQLSKIGKSAFPTLESLLTKTSESNKTRGAVAENVGEHEYFIPKLIELLPHAEKELQEKLMFGLGMAFISHGRYVVQCFLEKVSTDDNTYFGYMRALVRKLFWKNDKVSTDSNKYFGYMKALVRESSYQENEWAENLIPYLATGDAKQKGYIINLLKEIGYGNLYDSTREELDACFELGSNPFRDTSEVLKYINVIKGDATSDAKESALKAIAECGGRESIEPVLAVLTGQYDWLTTWQAAVTLNSLLERTGEKINERKMIDCLFILAGKSMDSFGKREIVKELASHLGMTWLEESLSPFDESEVINKLREIGDDASQAILIAVIDNNYDGQPILLAIDALATLGNKECTLSLIKHLGSSICDVRLSSAKALARLGDKRWQNIVRGDDDDLCRLGGCGYPDVADALIFALLNSSSSRSSLPFKYTAIRCLERLAKEGIRREDILGALTKVYLNYQSDTWTDLAKATSTAVYNIARIRL